MPQPARAYTRRPGAKFIRKTEESEQQRFITWFKRQFPDVIIYTDFAAGLYLTDNERIRMVKMRSRPGMPDIYIDHPMTHTINGKEVTFHGCRIELKKTGEKIYKIDGVTLLKRPYTRRFKRYGKDIVYKGDHLAEQAQTLQRYIQLGYFARFAKGIDHAKELACWYMKLPKQIKFDDDLEF